MTKLRQALLTVHSFPPSATGTAYLLYDFLKYFPSDTLAVVHGASVDRASGQLLPFDRQEVSFWNNIWSRRIDRYLPELYIRAITSRALRLARECEVKRVYVHYPNDVFAIAGYRVAEKLKLPLTIYFDILWEEFTSNPDLARHYERRIVRYADQRFAITESAVDYLSVKHEATFQLMPHVIDTAELSERIAPIQPENGSRIHFAGAIYEAMNLDAVLRLVNVVNRLNGGISLDLYTSTAMSELVKNRIICDNNLIRQQFVPREQLKHVQQASAILYLPQSFNTNQAMIRHNMPTKTLEYCVARRPILVHSPKDSYLTNLARKHGFALIVDTADENILQREAERLLNDSSLQQELVRNAVRFARSRDAQVWSSWFYRQLCTT